MGTQPHEAHDTRCSRSSEQGLYGLAEGEWIMNLYYEAPSEEAFEDMKGAALEVWEQYRTSPGGYYEEKAGRIKDIKNVKDNFMYIFAMFDINNQRKCVSLLNPVTIEAVRERMVAGGNDDYYIRSILGV